MIRSLMLVSFGSELAIVGTTTSGVDSKEGLFVKFGPGVLPETDSVDFSIFDFPSIEQCS